MSNKYVITYGWREQDPKELEEYGRREDLGVEGRHHLYTAQGEDKFPSACVEVYTEKYCKAKGYEERYGARCLTMYEDRKELWQYFNTLEAAQDYCEYTILGGEMPDSLKIAQVEKKLDKGINNAL